jgi:macrodomain Ter protein organizer (MatP/YcbG family)
MSTLAKPTLDNKAQLADAFAKGNRVEAIRATTAKIFNAPAGYRRLTINLREDIHKKIRLKAIEQDCTVTDIITKLLEKEVK